MEKYEEYWALLPKRDNDVYFELQTCLKDLISEGCSTQTQRIQQSTVKFLEHSIRNYPYPTCQLLSLLPAYIYADIVYTILANLSHDLENEKIKSQVFNLLTNLNLPERFMSKIRQAIFPMFIQNTDGFNVNGNIYWLCLISSKQPLILETFIQYEEKYSLHYLSNKSIFSKAINKKKHFLENWIFNKHNKNSPVPVNIRDILYIVKSLSNIEKYIFQKEMLLQVSDVGSCTTGCTKTVFFHELNRLFNIKQLLYYIPNIQIGPIIARFNLIDYLRKHLDLSTFDYESLSSILFENNRINLDITESLPEKCLKFCELELYKQFFVIKLILDVILLNQQSDNFDESSIAKMKKVKNIMRSITSFPAYVEVLEAAFSLFFLRWSHVINDNIDLDRTIESGSESDLINPSKIQSKKYEKFGFVCSLVVVENILKTLKLSSSQKKYSEEFIDVDDDLKNNFTRIYESINDAQWRLSLFKTTGAFEKQSRVLIKKFIIEHISNQPQRTSSDDEDNDNKLRSKSNSSILRRKPSKKHPFRKSSNGEMSFSFSHSTENERKSGDGLSRTMSINDKRCIVSKMLGPPEHLVTMCMCKGDLETTRQMIKNNNLENSPLASELLFSENMTAVKSKLREVFIKYEKEGNFQNPDSTVEKIKKAAAIGFEASKITNIIATFATENEIEKTNDVKMLLERFLSNYNFLGIYIGSTLHATIVVDLVLSLANNYDICFNILNMILKIWDKTGIIEKDNNTFGYFRYFKNLVDCLHQFKNVLNENMSIQTVIYDECYSLCPKELSIKLEKEKTFKKLDKFCYQQLDTIDTFKSFIKNFEEIKTEMNYFKRVYSFVLNMIKLLQLKEKETQKTPTEILNLNTLSLIGEIVFENSISPLEIEGIVFNINTNLLYALALNIVPIINAKATTWMEDNKLLEGLIENLENGNIEYHTRNLDELVTLKMENTKVFNYIKKQNSLLAYLIKEICLICDENITFKSLFLSYLMNLEEVKYLAVLYGNNLMMSALNFDKFNIKQLQSYILTYMDYRKSFHITQLIKDTYNKSESVRKLQDILISKILVNASNEDNCALIEHINDINLKATCLLENILKIESCVLTMRLIRNILLHSDSSDLDQLYKQELTKWLHDINVYVEISEIVPDTSWLSIMKISIDHPEEILDHLIQLREYKLCLRWSHIHKLCANIKKYDVFINIFTIAIRFEDNVNMDLFKLIESLPIQNVLNFYDSLLCDIRSLNVLQYLVDFLVNHSEGVANYQKYRISLKIFEHLSKNEQNVVWNLISMPLLIIEQYIMNTKLETLSCILTAIKPLLNDTKCPFCCLRRDSIFEIISNTYTTKFDSKDCSLITNNRHHKNCISRECIDSLLQTYAAKALDFRVSESHSSSDLLSQSTDMFSLDSLCGTFVMPKEAVPRSNWIRDEEATNCMCCRRSVFTMLMRRHHCRQCGRVVCHACSTKRMLVSNLYADILVRVCDECYKQTDLLKEKISKSDKSPMRSESPVYDNDYGDWQFSGDSKHDELLREEFCFEYAPSVSLCLSILTYHSSTVECSNFLLYHCRKFEKLLRPIQPGYPNPEVDYVLVTRMLNCLALAAKVNCGPSDCDTVRDHAEIIRSIVQNGCESLLPMEPPNSSSFRKLQDSLMVAEKWSLALELTLKCGFTTTGVLAAWGIVCLKSGCFETAREKFVHCMPRTCTEVELSEIIPLISCDNKFDVNKISEIPKIKRPQRSPPLLTEIINILEIISHPPHADVLVRANLIKDSNTSLTSNRSKKINNILIHEPALNILHTLANLKQTSQGVYASSVRETLALKNKRTFTSSDVRKLAPSSRFHEESIYYLTNFGSHRDIVQFFVKNELVLTALKYCIYQNVESEVFTNIIFLPYLKRGKSRLIISYMQKIDETLLIWKEHIIQTCRHLEQNGLLNSLYQLQILLNDPIRASMTCVKFYSMNCITFRDLQNNSFHLVNAQKHLQAELEMCQWEEIKVSSKLIKDDEQSLLMKMDSRTLNSHINTIWRQMEVTKFLAKCEQDGRETVELLLKICLETNHIPTFFGTLQEKFQLAVLTLICGSNIEEGFGLTFRIIQEFNLSTIKVYGITAKYLSGNGRLQSVEKLIDCIQSNNGSDISFCDEILSLSIQTAVLTGNSTAHLRFLFDSLIRLINDIGIKINCHIIGGQLKSAYLLAVQHNRLNDVKKVLRQAEQTNQIYIKKLCEKKLNISNS